MPQVRVLRLDANLGRSRVVFLPRIQQAGAPGLALFETWVNVNLNNLYIPPPAVVSWWKGDIHLPPFLCQIELANILPGTFVPLQVASCMAS